MIQQPSNISIKTANGSASFRWNPLFANEWQERYDKAQSIVAQDVLKFSEPYTPLKSGRLIRSGTVDEEEGIVTWTVPYARHRYYMPQTIKQGLRGSFWFERMKTARKQTIVNDAKQAFK